MIYELAAPKKILFGRGIRHQLPGLLPPGPVFILCGTHAKKRIEAELLPALSGHAVQIYSGFPAEAPLAKVDEVLCAVRSFKAASVIGWGGGSIMDAAKTVAALTESTGTVADYFFASASLPAHRIFFAAVPTTAGTAAELSPNAVIHDEASGVKKSLRGEEMFADAALIDPELLDEAPLKVLIGSGFDALTQGIESAISRKADDAGRLLAIEGAYLSYEGLSRCAQGFHDRTSSDLLSRGCTLSGTAFVRSGLGAAHGIGHPISGLRGVPHGICCAILLVEILRWNLPAAKEAMTQLALRFGVSTPEEFIDLIAELRTLCALPENFRDYGLAEKDFPFVVKNCRSGSMKCNPREFTDEEVTALLKKLI